MAPALLSGNDTKLPPVQELLHDHYKNVIPIEANLPHAAGEVVCGACGHRAVSARPVGVEPLECPECGEIAMVGERTMDCDCCGEEREESFFCSICSDAGHLEEWDESVSTEFDVDGPFYTTRRRQELVYYHTCLNCCSGHKPIGEAGEAADAD